MSAHSVRSHLRLEVAAYDETIRRFIPGYEQMLEEAATAVAAIEPSRVLDLGAGTGALAQALLQRREVGVVELVDVDPEMLAQARVRLGEYGDRVRFSERSFDDPLPACDAIASSLALHHIPNLEAKGALFERAFEALPPGGLLVNADCNMPADEGERDRLFRYWAEHQVSRGFTEEEAWRHFEEWSAEDTYLPLEDELRALESAGFAARQIWNAGPIGVVVARKARERVE